MPINDRKRIILAGTGAARAGSSVTHFALFLKELATNAAKYGALSWRDGWVTAECPVGPSGFRIVCSGNVAPVGGCGRTEDFGSQFCRTVHSHRLGDAMTRIWQREGLVIELTVSLTNLRR